MDKKKPYEAPGVAEDRAKALKNALGQIEKNFGKGAVMRLGDTLDRVLTRFPPALWLWTRRWASGESPAAVSSRSLARSPPARPPLRCTSWPRPKSRR